MKPSSINMTGKKLILAVALCACLPAAALETVKREIQCGDGVLWITDYWHINETMAMREHKVWLVFREGKEGGTNLLRSLQVLLAPDDLEIQEYDAKYREDHLDLKIISRIKFESPEKPAKLRWLSTFCGKKVGVGNVTLGEPGDEMLIFKKEDQLILWFPELGPADDFVENLSDLRKAYEVLFPEPAEYECSLNSGVRTEKLFFWNPNAKIPATPDAALLKRIHQVHKISCNDLVSLCTNMKIAKGGCYPLFCKEKIPGLGSKLEKSRRECVITGSGRSIVNFLRTSPEQQLSSLYRSISLSNMTTLPKTVELHGKSTPISTRTIGWNRFPLPKQTGCSIPGDCIGEGA
jgi:hypothetical protein